MDKSVYLDIFQRAEQQLNKKILGKKKLLASTGIVLESVFLKLYKQHWANPSSDLLTSPSRIFFSIWVNDSTIQQNRIYYNIHALKLRELEGYHITSRQFAADFRIAFKPFEKKWPNVSTDFGPLTLMEGWMPLNIDILLSDTIKLTAKFLAIDNLIDELLEFSKK